MVKRVKFDRGDIVRVNLNSTVGREQQGDFRPALVLSPAAFNALGVALVAPITQGGERESSLQASPEVPCRNQDCVAPTLRHRVR
jgi:mRNA-degrading endonuclease toxin of MazEF toxin-antitoxin module